MALIDPRTWLERMSTAQCWQMAAEVPVGRIGVLHDSAPEIYPVNHAVVHHSIVFRTDAGGKLEALLRSPTVCFEVDGIDPASATGWSVLMKGQASEVRHADERSRLDDVRLQYWVPGDKQHWVRIVPRVVTGRRIWRSSMEAERHASAGRDVTVRAFVSACEGMRGPDSAPGPFRRTQPFGRVVSPTAARAIRAGGRRRGGGAARPGRRRGRPARRRRG